MPLAPTTPSRSAGSLIPSISDFTDPKQTGRAATSAATSLFGQGSTLFGEGNDALSPVISQLLKLLSGNDAAVSDAVAPQIRSVLSQYDTARQAIAELGPRSGGSASALTLSRFKEAGDIADLKSSARTGAIGQLSSIAQMLLGTGASLEGAGTQSLSDLFKTVQAVAERKDERSQQLWLSIGELAGAALLTWATAGAASPALAAAAKNAFAKNSGDFSTGSSNG
jgi:hypothetical protein